MRKKFISSIKRTIGLSFWIMILSVQIINAQWTQKTSPGGAFNARENATGFSISNKLYVGTGYDGTNHLNDFWEYDPSTDVWSQKADLEDNSVSPAVNKSRQGAVGFTISGKGYITTGYDGTNHLNDTYEYDPLANNWTKKANFAGIARAYAVGFTISTKGYVGTGGTGDLGGLSDFWEYDPLTDTWTQKANLAIPDIIFPTPVPRQRAMGFSVSGKGYIGLGRVSDQGNCGSFFPCSHNITHYQDLFEYDPTANTWTQKNNVPLAGRVMASAVTIGSKVYVGLGGFSRFNSSQFPPYSTQFPRRDFWEYEPTADSWTQIQDISGNGRFGSVALEANGRAYIVGGNAYNQSSLSNNLVKEIWEYNTTLLLASPTNFNATTISSSQIDLSWTASVGATGYEVYRNTSNDLGNATLVSTTSSTTYSDNGLTDNTLYYYWLKATSSNNSSSAVTASATTLSIAINAATNLVVTALSSCELNLTWIDNATNETGYRIERSIGNNSNFQQVTSIAANTTAITINNHLPDTIYYYRVTPYVGNSSAYSNEYSITTGSLEVPTNFVAAGSGENRIKLTWNYACDYSEFQIERSVGNNNNFQLLTTLVNQTNPLLPPFPNFIGPRDVKNFVYYDNNLSDGKYYYRIRAKNSNGNFSIYTVEGGDEICSGNISLLYNDFVNDAGARLCNMSINNIVNCGVTNANNGITYGVINWIATHGFPNTRFGPTALNLVIQGVNGGVYTPFKFIGGKCYTVTFTVLSGAADDLVMKMADDLVPAALGSFLNEVTTTKTQTIYSGKMDTQGVFETIEVRFTPTENFCNFWMYGEVSIGALSIVENTDQSCGFTSHLSCSGNNITYDNNATVPANYTVTDYIALGDVDQVGDGVAVNLNGTNNVDLRAGNYIDIVEGTDIIVSSTGYFNTQIQQCIEAASSSRTSNFVQQTQNTQELSQSLRVNLFPNPTQGRVNVEVRSGETSSIRILVINLKGEIIKVLEDTKAQSQTFPIDLNDQPKGIYLIRVITDQGSRMKRVVVD